MNLTSRTLATPPAAEAGWSLAAVRPGPLASRLAVAALAVGVVSGMAAACLTVILGSAPDTLATRLLTLGLPLLLVAMIGWRLATADASPRSGKALAWTAAASVVLITAAQAWSEIDGFVVRDALAVLFYGAALALVPAVISAVVLVATALVLRAAGSPISLRTAQVGLTAYAMLVTAAFDLWVAAEMHTGIIGMSTALVGTGVVLTARWCLVGKRP